MAIRPSGLGRGLGSLIPTKKSANDPSFSTANYITEDSPLREVFDSKEKIMAIDVEKIFPSPHQPRSVFNEEALEELANSMKEHGLIQPIIVSHRTGDTYELVAGERRLRAAKLAGMKTIDAIVRDFGEQKKMELALIENLQREDLNALEVSIAYKKLMDEFNLTLQQLAKKVGKSESGVNNYLRLLTLHDDVKQAILEGKLTEGHARTLAGLPEEDQLENMRKIIEGKMSVRDAEKIKSQLAIKKNMKNLKIDPELRDMEDRLAAALSTKVMVRRHGSTGMISIQFFSNAELNKIVDKITK
jgi:ParB family transcriptional regulator, chromosome partitioning protein